MAEQHLKPIHLDTLKISSISTEGPTKTATGGMAADTLLKYGKKFTIEMQDAMGRYDTLAQLYGADVNGADNILAITDRFPGEMTLVGTTFVIDQATGIKQPLRICIPIFNCDGIFNLTQDAEGDVSTFDLNGQIARFDANEAKTEDVKEHKYVKGSDNCFYFFATPDAMKKDDTSDGVVYKGYRSIYKGGAIKAAGGNAAKLSAMLAKFGVVTVMDVDIIPAKRFKTDIVKGTVVKTSWELNGTTYSSSWEADEADIYKQGEWDAVATFAPYYAKTVETEASDPKV